MKSFRFLGLLISLLSLNGCIALAPLVFPVGATLSAASAAASIHQEITRADSRITLNVGVDEMSGIAMITFKDLDISFEKEEKNKDGDAITIEGKTAGGIKIRILAVKITNKASEVGIWAKDGSLRKADFAMMISQKLMSQAENAKIKGKGLHVVPTAPTTSSPTPVVPPPASKAKSEAEVAAETPVTYLVIIKTANVREAANDKSKIITTLKKGEKVENLDNSGNWFNVKLSSGLTGWVFKDLVKEAK